MILAQANFGRGVGPAEFRLNARRMYHAGGARAVFAFQEIDEADLPEEMAYLAHLTKATHTIVGESTAVPILVPHRFEIVDSRVTLGCKGLAKFTPNRPINEVELKVGPNLTVGLLNFHNPIDRPETQSRREQVIAAAQERAAAYDNGAWVADTNWKRGRFPRIAEGERVLVNAGIDKAKAWAAEDRRLLIASEPVTIPLTIDNHNGHVTRLFWRAK